MNNKTLGYILGGVGLVAFALSYPGIRAVAKLPAIPGVKDTYLMVVGVALLVAGIFLAFRKVSGDAPKEIPIYEGTGKNRKVVAIQRVGED